MSQYLIDKCDWCGKEGTRDLDDSDVFWTNDKRRVWRPDGKVSAFISFNLSGDSSVPEICQDCFSRACHQGSQQMIDDLNLSLQKKYWDYSCEN